MDAESKKLATQLHKAAKTGEAIQLPLDTDDRVLARVTDGIYRQPSSAIRELLANAYDADATEVAVLTDVPRYSEVLVRDNGNGMTGEVLINMIRHIGGSEKRTSDGQQSGVTSPDDPQRSPGGRKLIGKIGIGLFSVSQLTRQFTIITKPKSEAFRYTAVVTLHRYTDDDLRDAGPGKKYHAGETVLTSERVEEDEGHGTTIVLRDLIPRAKRILQSADAWTGLLNPDQDTVGVVRRVRPAIHSGFLKPNDTEYLVEPQVPWGPRTKNTERMRLLGEALIDAANNNELYAQLENALDYYYRMIWTLGLSLPLPYIDIDPFDLPDGHTVKCFKLSNKTPAASDKSGDDQAAELKTGPKTPVKDASHLNSPREGADFKVDVDGIRLSRPIRFDKIKGTSRALQTPLLFVGGYQPDLKKFDKSQRGGEDLEFTGYFYWTPRVIPKEHIGLLVRINGASGTLFDTTYLNYQIAERQRLKQIVSEVFVSKGLEEALNIDRESFNTAHPHYQILLNWVHNSLRQVINKQKSIETTARKARQEKTAAVEKSAVQKIYDEEVEKVLGEDEDSVREVLFTDDADEKDTAEDDGIRVFSRTAVVERPITASAAKVTDKLKAKVDLTEQRAAALVKLLDAYNLLEELGPEEQAQLITAIIRIFNTGA